MRTIEYYFSLLSPFSYLAGDRLERIAKGNGAGIAYHPVDIVTIGNETGWTPPAKRHPARAAYRLQDLARLAAREDLPINLRPAHWPTNAGPASGTVAAAVLAGEDVAPLVRGFLGSVWAQERDIADTDTIATVLAENRIAPSALAPYLDEGDERFRTDTREAPGRGVFGVPFYIVDDERFWGQDRLDELKHYLATSA